MSKLTALFEQFFLLEDKREHVLKTYQKKIEARIKQDGFMVEMWRDHEEDEEAWPTAENAINLWYDASGKHLVWIIRQWCAGDFLYEDFHRVEAAIQRFEQARRQLEKKDLMAYKNLSDLEDALDAADDTVVKSSRQVKQEIKLSGAEKVFEDNVYVVVRLLTEDAAKYYGKGTRWCTAAENNNMFAYYNEQGPIYVIINKRNNRKWQLHNASRQFMDEKDHPVDFDEVSELAGNSALLTVLGPISPPTFREHVDADTYLTWILRPEAAKDLLQYIETSPHIKERWKEAEDVFFERGLVGSYTYLLGYVQTVARRSGYKIDCRTFTARLNRAISEYSKTLTTQSLELPEVVYAMVSIMQTLGKIDRWKELEQLILAGCEVAPRQMVHHAVRYVKIRGDKWPELEPYVLRLIEDDSGPIYAFDYMMAAHGSYYKWPELEQVLSVHAPIQLSTYGYVLGERLDPQLEARMLQVSRLPDLNSYARKAFSRGERWPGLEQRILEQMTRTLGGHLYTPGVPHDDLPYELEILRYIEYHIEGRWPELEQVALAHMYVFVPYMLSYRHDGWPEMKEVVLKAKNPQIIYKYAMSLPGRWIEAEKKLEQLDAAHGTDYFRHYRRQKGISD